MNIIVNNKQVEIAKDITLMTFLKETNKDPKKILVAINDNVIPKDKYQNTILKEADSLDLMSFVGGG